MAKINEVDPTDLILAVAEALKKVDAIKAPQWALWVKTAHYKKRPPVNSDWWHVRAASILRKIYILGPLGTNKLKTVYSGKKRRGHKKPHFYKASGSIIRKILQQLEKAEFIKKHDKTVHKGRIIAPKGIALLDKVAKSLKGAEPAIKVAVKVAKVKNDGAE